MVSAQLFSNFYTASWPKSTGDSLRSHMGASLLHFHDCFVKIVSHLPLFPLFPLHHIIFTCVRGNILCLTVTLYIEEEVVEVEVGVKRAR